MKQDSKKSISSSTKKESPEAKLLKQIKANRDELRQVWQQLRLGTTSNYKKIPQLKKEIARNFTKIRQLKEDK